MFRTAWTIGHVRGIPVRLHVSLVLIVPLIAMSVASNQIPMQLGHMGVTADALVLPPWVLGLLMAFAVFASVALHELGHALTSLAQGGRVKAITLMLLGGVTEIDHQEATAKQEFWMALAGPLVSFALGILGLLVARIPGMPVDAYVMLWLFGAINLFIGVFNLVPAFPLDGGRILRAGLQRWMDVERATRVAASVGRFFAIAGGLIGLMTGEFMLVLIAAFVYLGAGAEEASVRMKAGLEGLQARQAMVTEVVTVGPRVPMRVAAAHMLRLGAGAALVRDLEGVYGAIAPQDLRRGDGVVADLIEGEPLVVGLDDDLGEVVAQMRSRGCCAIVRDEINAIVGVVTFSALNRALALRRIAGDVPAGAVRPVRPSTEREERG